MQLSKLIGLEVLKLHEEGDSLVDNIAQYETILSDKKELYKVIKTRLREYKKLFAAPRKTLLTNAENENYVEEVKEEELYILIDRFGYTKTLDASTYGRTSEDTKAEHSFIVSMKNTDKLCVFTAEGNMYQVKGMNLPKCRAKDKGTLIHSLCKLEKEEVLAYFSFEELFDSMLLFTTQNGFIKLVSGAEFETIRSVIASTKLETGDKIVSITQLSASDILAGDRKVIILTKDGLSLGFQLNEVSQLKRSSRGVKAISLTGEDQVVFGNCPVT